jgi:hypothetical protein
MTLIFNGISLDALVVLCRGLRGLSSPVASNFLRRPMRLRRGDDSRIIEKGQSYRRGADRENESRAIRMQNGKRALPELPIDKYVLR